MRSHVIIPTNVERAFACIQNVSFSIAWVLSFETFSQWILIMSHTHTPQLIPDQLSPPYPSTFMVFPFFPLNLLSLICVAQLLLDVGVSPGYMVDWPRVTTLKKNSSPWSSSPPRCGCALFASANVLCPVVAIAGSPQVRFAHCVWKTTVFLTSPTPLALTMLLLFHNDPWASGSSVQDWEFHSLLFSARWPVVGLYVYHCLL